MDRGAWRGYSPWGRKELDTTEQLNDYYHHEITNSFQPPLCWNQLALESTVNKVL